MGHYLKDTKNTYMDKGYTEITSSDFIKNLDFDFVELYSLQGDYEAIELELEKLEENYSDLSEPELKRYSELDEYSSQIHYLINQNGEFHPSSVKTNAYKKDNEQTENLKHILHTEIVNQNDWMCAPIYRDAIVFYKSDKIISYLNICLGCERMEIEPCRFVSADSNTYKLLRDFFIENGHKVELPENN